MQEWNQGYVTDTSYTNGYYGTLNPLRIKLCFLAQNLLPPTISTACELGFGQGITLNFNSASRNAMWYGTDFNPSQAAFAKNLSKISQAPIEIYNNSFEELLEREDLPNFDFIALHGIYSWVSPKVREQILSFIRKKLNVGGVVLISYNTQAGWASVAPLRDLLYAYSTLLTPSGKSSPSRAREGLNFVNELMSLPSTEAIKNPQSVSMLQTLCKMDDTYLAHELLNEVQNAFNFSQMSNDLGSAKLEFASYANFSDHLCNIQLSEQEHKILSSVSHSKIIYEMLKDLMFATSFRSDYWAKGVIRLNAQQSLKELLKLKVVMIVPFSKVDYTLNTRRGVLNLNQDFYSPILNALKDNQPVFVEQIKEALEQSLKREVYYHELLESLIALSSKDYIKLAQDEETIQLALPHTQALNRYILSQALESSNALRHLISPVSAEAIALNRFELLFLQAYLEVGEERWLEYVRNYLKEKNEKISKNGKELEGAEIEEELQSQIQRIKEWIPVFKALRVI